MEHNPRQIFHAPWDRSSEGFRPKGENKEPPAPIHREGLRKKCPGTDDRSELLCLPAQVSKLFWSEIGLFLWLLKCKHIY